MIKKQKRNSKLERLTVSVVTTVLAVFVAFLGAAPAHAKEGTAATMRMEKAEGTVQVLSSSGKKIEIFQKMKLKNGNKMDTEEESYAWISLDDTKLIKMDAVSVAGVRKKGEKLEIFLTSGALFFNISEPLEGDEILNIRTSSMTVGIRGTSGWVRVVDEKTVNVNILEGNTQVCATNPLTGEVKQGEVAAGESATCVVFDEKEDEQTGGVESCGISVGRYTEKEVSGFVLMEVVADKALSEEIFAQGGVDLRNVTVEEAQTRLKEEQVEVHKALEEIKVVQSEQKSNVSVEQVWANPAVETAAEPEKPDDHNAADVPAAPERPTKQDKKEKSAVPEKPVNDSLIEKPVVPEPVEKKPETAGGGTHTQAPSTPGATQVDSGTWSDDLEWKLDGAGTLTISGSGAMPTQTWIPWYDKRAQIKAVVIENGVTNIGEWTFYECSELKSVTIPSSVTSIARYAFVGCRKLESVTLPSGLTSIEEGMFNGCSGLTSITIPGSVTNIGNWAFTGCEKLTSVTLPNGVTTIGKDAFGGCSGLTSITIPNSVTSIGKYAFTGCEKLTSITISDGVTGIGDWAFASCSGLTGITIPSSVTSIGKYAFASCRGLTNVTIPSNVKDIGESAFEACYKLASAIITDGVETIGERAFWGCGLTSVDIPASVKSIGGGAFAANYLYNNNGGYFVARRVTISVVDNNNDYSSNSDGVFSKNGSKLVYYLGSASDNYSVPSDVTSIEKYAFADCQLQTVTIPANVTKIEEEAFAFAHQLKNITVDSGNGTYCSENGVLFNQDKTTLICFPIGKSREDASSNTYAIPDTVTSIGNNAFYYCYGLQSVTIPSSVTSIGEYAFYCSGLTSVDIPSGVTSIGNNAFGVCSQLTSVTIPDSVTSIGEGTFSNCIKLTNVNIPSSVTSIGDSAFSNCTGLTSVTISDGVTSIGNSAFINCTGLTNVRIPNGVTSIGYSVFYGCSGLTTVRIPAGVTTMNGSVFDGCSALKEIHFGGKEEEWNEKWGWQIMSGSPTISYNQP